MIHILLTILSVIGTVLLALLGIGVFLILCLLFTPICYRGTVKKQEKELSAQVKVSWLLRLVYVKVQYEEKKVSYEIYVLGIPILKLKNHLAHKREEKARKTAAGGAKKKPTVPPGGKAAYSRTEETSDKPDGFFSSEHQGNPSQQETSQQETSTAEEKEEMSSTDLLWEKAERLILKIIGIIGKAAGKIAGVLRFLIHLPARIWGILKKICFTIRSICGKIKKWYKFFTSKTFKEAFRVIRTEGMAIIRHIFPRKITGVVRFGFADPSATGKALGALGFFYPVIPKKLAIVPVFEEAKLDADVRFKGRIFLIVLLVHGLKIYRNKCVKRVIKKFQHKEA